MAETDENVSLADLRQLIVKRRQIKSALTRFVSYLERFSDSDTVQLEIRLAQTLGLLDNFNNVQDQLEIQLTDNLQKHLRSLASLGEPVESWSTLLIYLITKKLDFASERAWEEYVISKKIISPTITDDLIKFLNQRCQLLEAISREKVEKSVKSENNLANFKKQSNSRHDTGSKSFSGHVQQLSCAFCKREHLIYYCDKLRSMPPDSRLREINKMKRCTNCLRRGHSKSDCRSQGCKKCNGRHNTLLHDDNSRNPPTTSGVARSGCQNVTNSQIQVSDSDDSSVQENNDDNSVQSAALAVNHSRNLEPQILLSTANILIKDGSNRWHECRALLDSGSQPNFVTTRLMSQLRLDSTDAGIPVIGVGNSTTRIAKRVRTEIKSLNNEYSVKLTFLVLDEITECMPNFPFSKTELNIPKTVKLADSNFHLSSMIDILLGAGIFFDLLCSGRIKLGENLPVLQQTLLGWIISGPLPREMNSSSNFCNLAIEASLDKQIEKFWLLEEVTTQKPQSREEIECENLFVETTRRDDSGHLVVTLPTRENVRDLGENLTNAVQRLYAMERKFSKNVEFKQLIVWRKNETDEIGHYRLNTVTYGTASASFLAVRSLQQVAHEHYESYPYAADAILSDFYVDDLITGSNEIESTIDLKHDISILLDSYGFPLRKWLSNSPHILENSISNENCYVMSDDDTRKTLGLLWCCTSDTLEYRVNEKDFALPRLSKRTMLSAISKIFDPLGIISPVIITVKILIQELWQLKISWDDTVPPSVRNTWMTFTEGLTTLCEIKLPRQAILHSAARIELHGFCDASQRAYGACVYVRSITNNTWSTQLLCSKSRVAPLKTVSLPRLELCGALLLTRPMSKVLEAIKVSIDSVSYWTDSSIVLCWISAPPNTWKLFVSNHVSKIQGSTDVSQWRHVSSTDNPADLVSRGISASQLPSCKIWWHGPVWLIKPENEWPQPLYQARNKIEIEHIPEKRHLQVSLVVKHDFSILDRYSSLYRLQRIVAFCLRFAYNASNSFSQRKSGAITVDEMNHSVLALVKLSQHQDFSQEINCCPTFIHISELPVAGLATVVLTPPPLLSSFSATADNFVVDITLEMPLSASSPPFSTSAWVPPGGTAFLAYSSPSISIFRRIVAPMLRLMSSSVARAADTKRSSGDPIPSLGTSASSSTMVSATTGEFSGELNSGSKLVKISSDSFFFSLGIQKSPLSIGWSVCVVTDLNTK
nr:unnamed protein product [Callosobruchus analis]